MKLAMELLVIKSYRMAAIIEQHTLSQGSELLSWAIAYQYELTQDKVLTKQNE